MGKSPEGEEILNDQEGHELSFDEKVALADVLFKAVDDRNVFIQRQGGFDTFAEAGQHVGGMRDAYDEMEKAVSDARRDVDEKISDKEGFVRQLREAGRDDLADMSARMFRVSEK